ncbi:hypothetical protein Desti_4539 [Desulfomonile tiedjei DSM 6799]|uniref:Uncharacterized protein n=1 Tax=Desulfomonile tiedjei (strain ATCC 49306 / DSM 6799 / DCB-1) TaxID=706587 RepID=I4CC76_DESTA|nr:hypothetical protein Desti_4539 [Desulfomonile tiedjei DSM 6799]
MIFESRRGRLIHKFPAIFFSPYGTKNYHKVSAYRGLGGILKVSGITITGEDLFLPRVIESLHYL